MKVTSVEFHPEGSSSTVVLSFRDPTRRNRYNVKSIVGLDAEDIVARFYGGSGSSKFYNISLEDRDVVATISLNPRFELDESYSSLRDDLYRLISLSRTGVLQIQFKNGENVVAVVSGFVNKFESELFEKEQGVKITINCDDPMLRAPVSTNVDVSDLDPTMTIINDQESTAPHGFKFEIALLDNVSQLVIKDPENPDWKFTIVPSGGFIFNDVVHFSSEFGDRYLYVHRGLSDIHLADAIAPNSIWPVLFPGVNKLTLGNPALFKWNALSHKPAYWGV